MLRVTIHLTTEMRPKAPSAAIKNLVRKEVALSSSFFIYPSSVESPLWELACTRGASVVVSPRERVESRTPIAIAKIPMVASVTLRSTTLAATAVAAGTLTARASPPAMASRMPNPAGKMPMAAAITADEASVAAAATDTD